MKVRVISKEKFDTFLIEEKGFVITQKDFDSNELVVDKGLALFRTSTGDEIYVDKVALDTVLGKEVEGEWKPHNEFGPIFLMETGMTLLPDMIENKMRYNE